MKSVVELPFNQHIGLERSDHEPAALRLPAGDHYLNHLGTVHAGALLALAEAASGEFLLQQLGSTAGIIPVVRRLEAKFRKPANGAVTSTANTPTQALAQVHHDLAAKGRALVTVTVQLHDASESNVLSATVEWFIQNL